MNANRRIFFIIVGVLIFSSAAFLFAQEPVVNSDKIESTQVAGDADKLYEFKLGDNVVFQDNSVKFDFPMETGSLYLFSLMPWKGDRPANAELTVTLYNASQKQIMSSKSVCISKSDFSFGSLVFSGIKQDNIGDVKYFSASVQECSLEK